MITSRRRQIWQKLDFVFLNINKKGNKNDINEYNVKNDNT